MVKCKSLDDIIEQMRNMGDLLVPYNFPLGHAEWEDDLNILKTVECTVDGYNLILHFSRADYDINFLETLQIMSRDTPFLPFNLVAKIAKKMLGGHNLSLVELLRGKRKIYCWTLTVDKSGRPLKPKFKDNVEKCVYEGFEYGYIDPSSVNFY